MYTPSRRLSAASTAGVIALLLAGCADDEPTTSASEPTAAAVSAAPTPTVNDFCSSYVSFEEGSIKLWEIEEEFAKSQPSPSAEPTATASSSSSGTGSPSEASASPEPSASAGSGGGAAPPPELTAKFKALFDPLTAELTRTAPAEVKADVGTLTGVYAKALESGNDSEFESASFKSADTAIDRFLLDKCGFEKLEVTAADYEFTGVPSTAKAGETAITLTNDGEEIHEIALLRLNDGVDLSGEELFALGEEGIFTKSSLESITFVEPGTSSTSFFNLEPGKYVALCFIPKGSDAEHKFEGDGPPHAAEGMIEELTITETGEPDPSSSPSSTSSSSTSSSSSSSSSSSTAEESTSSPRPTSSARPTNSASPTPSSTS